MNLPVTPSYLSGIKCESERDARNDINYWWDPVCGNYGIAGSVRRTLDEDESGKRSIAYLLAQRKCRGFSTPIKILDAVGDSAADSNKDYVIESMDSLLAEYPKSPAQIIDEAFYNVTRLANHPSDYIEIDSDSCLLVYAHDGGSRLYMVSQFEMLGLIDEPMQTTGSSSFQISARGWQVLSEMEQKQGRSSNQAAYSRRNLPPIPEQACHPFQTKAATHSRAKLPPLK